MRKFIGVDGESFTVNGEHTYTLLASSTEDYIYSDDGLPTVECLEFLLRIRGGTLIAFGWNYDVNMILRDLDLHSLVMLWYNGNVRWNGYHLEWISSKWFLVRRGKHSAKVNDVFGFFQSSFVKALEKWNITPQPELEAMKEARSGFTIEMQKEVLEYCLGECKDLVHLMEKVQHALLHVKLKPKTFVGAGSIASALLAREGIKHHLVPDSEFPPSVQKAIMCAYYGGRAELFQQGKFPAVWDYDISSAYPSEAVSLPSLVDGHWTKSRKYEPDAPYALWHCTWKLDKENIVMPFPFRHTKSGDICYPYSGTGWYHAGEVAAAQMLTGDAIEIDQGWVFTPSNGNTKPFRFITDIYRYREQLQKEKHGGEKVLKLGLNSIYGKLAQGLGYQGKAPQFRSFFWAGLITSGTRARILNLAQLAPDDLIMVATDGIFFTRPLDIVAEGGLGGLDVSTATDVFVAQPGVYSYTDSDGNRVGKTRGFFSKEIDFQALEDGFSEHGVSFRATYPTHRFIGLGAAILNRDIEKWRTWQDSTRQLTFNPSTKFLEDYWEDGTDSVRHTPPDSPNDMESLPYKYKEHPVFAFEEANRVVEYVQGTEQPLRVF